MRSWRELGRVRSTRLGWESKAADLISWMGQEGGG